MTITLEEIQTLADRLTPHDQARLIEHLSRRLAVAVAPLPTPVRSPEEISAAAWERWAAFREDMHQHYPEANLAAQLEVDRRERDASLRSHLEEDDSVHA